MRRAFLLAVLLAVPLGLEAQNHPKVSRFAFMAGCWEGEVGPDNIVEEHWTSPTDEMMLATTRYLNKKREATGWEFTRIAVTDSGVVFAAASNGEAEHVYKLSQHAPEYVLFENLAKPFPQRIIYRLASDGALIARNEGEGQLSLEVRFRPVSCPGKKP
jgi:hypothetical protein